MGRVRRTNRDIFIDKLEELSNDGAKLVANRVLREALGWEEEKFKRMKAQLREEGLVIVGRGPGGTVGLSAGSSSAKELKVFVSYSHQDERLKDELMKHLLPLSRIHGIKTWHDRRINAGDEWKKAIEGELDSADIILLLVSIDFINSKYCYDVELETAMERQADGKAIVVPIILRSCMWQHTPFSKLQALPKDARAIASWASPDDAFVDVTEGLHRLIEASRLED